MMTEAQAQERMYELYDEKDKLETQMMEIQFAYAELQKEAGKLLNEYARLRFRRPR